MPPENEYHLPELRKHLERLANSDETALTEIYLHFQQKLLAFSTSLVRSKEIAEEVVEDVFVRLWVNREQAVAIENLSVYLYKAVKNRALNSLSQKAKHLVIAPFDYLDITLDSLTDDPHDLLVTAEMMDKMQAVIENLPPRCKMIFKLVREDGLRYKEVAEILNISVNTIDAQMAIAVKKICLVLNLKKPGKTPRNSPILKKEQ